MRVALRSVCAVGLSCITLVIAASRLDAQQTDVIRGRVTGPDSQPVAGVTVKATSYRGDVLRSTTTARDGRFAIVFINGEGDYWIDLMKIGLAPKRLEVRKVGDEEVLIVNVRMSDGAAKLGAVEVTGERSRRLPTRTGSEPDVGGGDRTLAATTISPDQAGNLAAMAAAVAGFQLIPGLDGAPDAFSALGLTGDQNNTTLDGLGSGVSALPPDILATTSIRPYPFDVSIGGFSGAQVAIQAIPGTNFSRRMMTTSAISPALEWGDAAALAQGRKFTNARLGGNAAGPIVLDRAFYNAAYNVGRQYGALHTLLNTSAAGLAAAGVASDSVRRLATVLQALGISTTSSALSNTQAEDVAQVSANVDLMPGTSGAGSSFTLGGAGNVQRTQPMSRGAGLLATPSHSGETSYWGGNLMATHAAYFGFGVLSRTTLGYAASSMSMWPYESVPEGTVRIASTLPDGTTSVKSLSFGGGSTLSSLRNQALQAANSLTWFTLDSKHSLKLTSSVMRDRFGSDAAPSPLGTFNYNSLADLEAQQPASFTRTLTTLVRTGDQLSGALSLGDSWRPTPGVQVQYGIRVDGNRFLDAPAYNADLFEKFGVSNATVPNRLHVSPRVGLQWYYGDLPDLEYAPGAARPPRAVIHAGAGVFQNVAPAQLIGTAVASTGLRSSTQSASCIGAAAPVPDWMAYRQDPSAVPTACAATTSGNSLALVAPNVTRFDPRFQEPRSVRGAADWSGPVLANRFVLGLQGIVSTGLDQQGQIDLNLDPTPRFVLDQEGGRPVFVPPSAIVPSTGAVSIAGSRVTPAYQHVWSVQSSLAVRSEQLSINLKPISANPRLRWDATYTLLDTRQSYHGFASTAGNPFEVAWGPNLQASRHTVLLHWTDFPVADVVYLSSYVTLMSGQRYSPMVAGDLNGDGMLNDRAFIIDPSSPTANAQEADAMRSLLASTTHAVRSCLQRQIGKLADRGSCQTPWTVNSALQLKLDPRRVGLPRRATVSVTIDNVAAFTDLALHGSNALRGWGESVPADQNLLFVRGFDPATRQFRYDVNQRFGSTRPQQSSAYAVPYVSLGVSIDIGVPRDRQVLTQQLNEGRRKPGIKPTALGLASLGMRTIPNPMLLLLQQSDSLHLTQAQADSLASLSRAFAAFADSVWIPAGKYLAALPDEYNTAEAYARYAGTREKTVNYLLTLVPMAKAVLTPAQRRRIPPIVASYLDERVLRYLRSSSATSIRSY